MNDLNFKDINLFPPQPYERIIVTDGQYFRSGTWVPFNPYESAEGFVVADKSEGFEFQYWAPAPRVIK